MTEPRWIKVSETPPLDGIQVNVITESVYGWGEILRTVYLAAYETDDEGKHFWWDRSAGREVRGVTMYCYLPPIAY